MSMLRGLRLAIGGTQSPTGDRGSSNSYVQAIAWSVCLTLLMLAVFALLLNLSCTQ